LAQEQTGRDYGELLKMFKLLEDSDNVSNHRSLKSHIVHKAVEAYRRSEISRGRLLDLANTLNIPGNKLLSLAEATKNY
jgi:hypothetical protein